MKFHSLLKDSLSVEGEYSKAALESCRFHATIIYSCCVGQSLTITQATLLKLTLTGLCHAQLQICRPDISCADLAFRRPSPCNVNPAIENLYHQLH